MQAVQGTADPQTQAAIRIVAWVSHGALQPSESDFAMPPAYALGAVAAGRRHPAFGRAILAKGVRMSDPILGNDPNAAYDVVPTQGWPQGWTVTCNGISVRHFVNKTNAERYATNAEYRANLIVAKYADR
jgi:hypothetical protein